MTPRLLGAVLTGGKSSRMGRDKATLVVDGAAMVDRVGRVLRTSCSEVVAVGPSHLAGTLTAVPDLHPGQGPLGGVLSALSAGSHCEWVVVLACDLPWIDAATVAALIDVVPPAADEVADEVPDEVDVVVARSTHLEPMCAAWNVAAVARIEAIFAGGERSMHGALARLRVCVVDVAADALRNVNAPADLDH